MEADSFPKNTINGFKRLMGLYYQDDIIQQCLSKKYFTYNIVNKVGYPQIKVLLDSKEQFLFPQQVSGHLLELLMKSASRYKAAVVDIKPQILKEEILVFLLISICCKERQLQIVQK